MYDHRVAFPVASWPGCDGAQYQALQTADRPLCAFVTAYAAWTKDKTCLHGTLNGAEPDEIIAWIHDRCRYFQVPLGRVALWARAINGHTLDFVDSDIEPIGGLFPDPYQVMSMKSSTVAGMCMGLDPGLGKSLIGAALASVVVRKKHASASRCWIFCPLNAFDAWDKFLNDLRLIFDDVRVLSNDSAHKYTGAENTGGVLICDEVHEHSHSTARRTKSLHQIRRNFDFCIGQTGTLTHAGVESCLSIADVVVPGMALFANRWKAGEHFNCLVKKQLTATMSRTGLEKPSGENHTKFMEWLSRFTIKLMAESPEVQESVQIPDQEFHDIAIDEPWPDLLKEVVRIAEEILAAEGELPHMQRVVHLLCRMGKESKLDWVLSNITDDTPLVLFAHYRDTLDYSAKRLDDAGIRYFRIDGDTDKDDRPPLINAFQSGERQVFLLQTKAGGVGINLHRASVSVMLDHSWKAIDYAQAVRRTRRRGQTDLCHNFDVCANGLQKRIVERVRSAQDFDASVGEYQALKREMKQLGIPYRTGETNE